MQLWGQTFSEHEYIRSLGISTFISELRLVYRDELFFKVKKNNRIFFFLNFDRFDSFYLHSVSQPKNSTLIHNNFRVLSWRYHIHFKCHCFPSFTSFHAGIRGLVVYKKGKEKRIKNEIKVFRNGKWSVHRNFFLCFHGSNNQKKSRKKLPSMRFRIFKSTYYFK